jgi:hypothetical protein
VNPDDLSWAFLFLVVVAVIIVVGVLVGMIVAGRIDRLQAPRPARPSGEPTSGSEAPVPVPDTDELRVQEDQNP